MALLASVVLSSSYIAACLVPATDIRPSRPGALGAWGLGRGPSTPGPAGRASTHWPWAAGRRRTCDRGRWPPHARKPLRAIWTAGEGRRPRGVAPLGGCRVGAPQARAEAEGRRSRRGACPPRGGGHCLDLCLWEFVRRVKDRVTRERPCAKYLSHNGFSDFFHRSGV